MRSSDPIDESDLDVAGLRRSLAQEPSRKIGNDGGRRHGLRTYLLGGLVVVVLALFGSVVWMAYQDMMPGDGSPPLIRAEAGPIKVEPDERGGLPLLNEELVVVQSLNEPEAPAQVERIVPRQSEAPRSTADVIPEELQAEPDAEQASGTAVASAQSGETATADASDASDGLDSLLEDIASGIDQEPAAGEVQVAANDVAPDGNLEAAPAAEPPASAQLTPPATLELPAADPAATDDAPAEPASAPAAPVAPEPQATEAPEAAPASEPAAQALVQSEAPAQSEAAAPAPTQAAEPAPAPSPAVAPQPALAASFDGAFRVQLLAVRDEAAAAGAWGGLQERHQAVLGPLRSNVERATVGDGTFFRLQAGPFADRSGASAICEMLQAQGTDCFVVEPTS